MTSYVAYGLSICSTLPLPELTLSEAAPAVVIRLEEAKRLRSQLGNTAAAFGATADIIWFYQEEVGTFLIRGGREIVVAPDAGVEEWVLRSFILGPALGALLHQRGFVVLHASSVALTGGVVGFLGAPGWGKSTMAGAFRATWLGIVADDVTAVRLGPDGATVVPGVPQLKLWPEAAVALGETPDALSRVHPRLEKRQRPVVALPPAPLPLRRLYVLADGARPEIEPLPLQEAFVELVRHSYLARALHATGTAALHARQCAALAASVPICRLRRQRSLAALPDVARLVERDLTSTRLASVQRGEHAT